MKVACVPRLAAVAVLGASGCGRSAPAPAGAPAAPAHAPATAAPDSAAGAAGTAAARPAPLTGIGQNAYRSFEAFADAYVEQVRGIVGDRTYEGGTFEFGAIGHSVQQDSPGQYRAVIVLTATWRDPDDPGAHVELQESVTFLASGGRWTYKGHATQRVMHRDGSIVVPTEWPDFVGRLSVGYEAFYQAWQALDAR